ncbi:MAG: hypothetical protein GY795_29055 [Desulfobacterales bacterium]|nr:hypothetical protein [Desulfobacterales bacterium]
MKFQHTIFATRKFIKKEYLQGSAISSPSDFQAVSVGTVADQTLDL